MTAGDRRGAGLDLGCGLRSIPARRMTARRRRTARFRGVLAGDIATVLASPAGFEPTAPGLGILCSILLSYGDLGHANPSEQPL